MDAIIVNLSASMDAYEAKIELLQVQTWTRHPKEH